MSKLWVDTWGIVYESDEIFQYSIVALYNQCLQTYAGGIFGCGIAGML